MPIESENNIRLRNKSIDLMKIIGVITMVVDHIRYLFPKYQLWLIAIGRIAFIMFACCMALNALEILKNHRYSSLKNYFISLFVFGIISEIPYRLASGNETLGTINIMATLFMGLAFITTLHLKNFLLLPLLIGLGIYFNNSFEFGFLGILLIVAFYSIFYFKNKFQKVLTKLSLITALILSCLCNLQYYREIILAFGITSIWVYTMLIGCIFGFVLSILLSFNFFNFNNISVFKMNKLTWFFYPIHLLIIGILK